ncbi:hypothetical protein GCM10022206_12140 [Streptomyces chiangmaiensis]
MQFFRDCDEVPELPRLHSDGNARADVPCRFVVTMLCAPGQPMLTLVDEEELAQRAHLRASRPAN